jgi:hypothetical protein
MNEREERLQGYLDLRMTPEEQSRFEEELLASAEMSEELLDELSLRELVEARRARRSHRFSARRLTPRRWKSLGAVAAVAVLAFLFWPGHEATRTPTFRGDTAGAFHAIQPVGEVPDPPTRFRWQPVEDAASYRFELFDEDGHRVMSHSTTEPEYVVPHGVTTPESGYWQVTVLDEFGVAVSHGPPVRYRMRP